MPPFSRLLFFFVAVREEAKTETRRRKRAFEEGGRRIESSKTASSSSPRKRDGCFLCVLELSLSLASSRFFPSLLRYQGKRREGGGGMTNSRVTLFSVTLRRRPSSHCSLETPEVGGRPERRKRQINLRKQVTRFSFSTFPRFFRGSG